MDLKTTSKLGVEMDYCCTSAYTGCTPYHYSLLHVVKQSYFIVCLLSFFFN